MVLVNRSVDGDCDVVLGHAIEQHRGANRHQQGRPIRHQSRRVLNDFDILLVVVDVEPVVEFAEDLDGAGVGAVQGISAREKEADTLMSRQIDCRHPTRFYQRRMQPRHLLFDM